MAVGVVKHRLFAPSWDLCSRFIDPHDCERRNRHPSQTSTNIVRPPSPRRGYSGLISKYQHSNIQYSGVGIRMGTVIVVVDDVDIDFRANEGRF